MKTKVLFIAIILLASVFLSGCVDDSAENEKTDVGEVTEKTIQAQGQEESLDNETVQRITPEEAETNENTPVNEVTPENEASATEKVSTASSSGGKSSSFSSSSEEADKITVTDDLGREITVPYPCERTVFLVENAMNSMYAVGGADEISGIGAVWFEDTKAPFFRAIDSNYDKKRLSNGSEQPNNEKIATANPQVVFLWASDWESADIKAIEENLKVPVYGVFIDSLDDLQRQMKTFSKLIGNEERGDEVIEIMDKYMKKVTDVTGALSTEEKPTVYWMWGDVYGTAGLKSTANDLIGRAGGVNVLNNWTNETKSVEHPTLNLETLLELNPEVIYMWNNPKLDPVNITSGDTVDGIDFSTWKEISAVKNGRVYEISDPFVYDFHSPRLPLAMMHVAKDLHPDKFANLSLTQEADNYYVEVYGVHYPGFEKADGSEQTSITVTDDIGREITVPYPCERTVFLVENAMNSMYAVGGADEISGIGAVWFEDTKAPFFRAIDSNYDKKRLSNGSEQPNNEKIATANPQVVFLWASDWESADIKAIEENLKVPVYGVFIDSLDDLQRQMKTFSKLIGNEERGDEVIEIMDKYMKKVTDVTGALSTEEKPTVYWMWGDVYGTAGLKSTANDLIGRAGGVNVLNNWTNETKSVEHPTLNLETLLELNPEVIYMWNNPKLDPVNITSGDTVDGIDFSTWKEISAVKNGRVYEISDPFVYDFHSPRLPLAMMHVAKDLHPDKFANLSLTQEADNYYVEVYGVHYPGFEKA
jgi:iron complex transport system substrate-binding protein